MRKLKLTQARQQCFIRRSRDRQRANSAALAAASRTRVYGLRGADAAFAAACEEAEEIATDRFEKEARRRGGRGARTTDQRREAGSR